MNQEEFEDTKGTIRNRISKKNRQHNGQKKKDKRTNNDIQNTSQKTKDRTTRIPLKTGGELRFPGRLSSSCSTSGTRIRVVLFVK
jgi:mannose-6-phosphate isomerase-like protein (cupin superfamily)